MANSPQEADAIVDDIIDSGATRNRFASLYPDKPFYALYDYSAVKGPWLVFPWEAASNEDDPADNVRRLLQYLGDDPTREGLRDTPARYVKAMRELTSGILEDPRIHLRKNFALDDAASGLRYDEMIISKGLPFTSLCEHHMLPFSGVAHVGYIPSEAGRVVGLSKIARLVDGYAKRCQVQERLTVQISSAMDVELSPAGVGVILEARHTCQCMRGVKKDGVMVTSSLLGKMRDPGVRGEFIDLCRGVSL